MLKILDWYILKKFLGTFFFSISLILVIVIIFDISEKIDDFIQKHAPLKAIVLDYYFNFIPYFANLFSPLFTFITVIFFTSRMAANTEIVAILSSGISFKRILVPYIIGSVFISVLSLCLTNFVIPNANKKRIDFEEAYIKNPFYNEDMHIHRQIEPGIFIYMEHFNNFENTGYKFSLEKFKDRKLYYKLMSETIKWDSVKQDWKISNYFIRHINDTIETIKMGSDFDTTLSIRPSEFGRKLNNIETMNYSELNSYIDKEKLKGSDKIEFYEIEKAKRTAFPFATVILTLVGVSMSSRKVRGGIGMHIGIGLLISFSFILGMQVTTTFAAGGLLSPLLAVWIPNISFGILAIALLKNSPK